MTDELLPAQIRRLSLYRQLSDALKSKRKSLCHVSSPPPLPLPTSTWDYPPKDESKTLVKQKSISYDDVAFLSNTEESSVMIDEPLKTNGRFFFLSKRKIHENDVFRFG